MSNLPFTQYGFQLYDTEDVEKLIAKSQFVQVKLLQKEEWIPGKTGDGPVKRNYTILTLKNNIMNTLVGDLKEKWAQLKAETPHLRIRNAAEQLGVSEGRFTGNQYR